MPKFNHAVSLAFTVISDHEQGEDFTPAMLKAALEARIRDLDNSPSKAEWLEAIGAPHDTMPEDETAPPVIHEYLFDVELLTAIRVKATSEAEARQLLKDYVDGTEANLGSWPDGDPILCQVAFDDDEHLLAEIDGQAV